MKRPFLQRVVVVLWLLCGGVAAGTAFIGIAGLYDILSQPMNNTADPWAGFTVISPAPAPATMREALPPLPPGFVLDRRIARLPNGEELHFPANTSNEVMDRTVQSHMAHTAMEQGRQTNAAAPQRGLGERVARVISQIDTVTVVFLLLPSLLCIAFVSLFQYLVLGSFSPLALFRSRK